MRVFDPAKLQKVAWWEYAERFLLGACVSSLAAIVGHVLGERVGGAFLAFPAILPASVTLASKKDGLTAAVEHEIGAVFGGAGLVAFSVAVGLAANRMGNWAIAAGGAAWAAAALGSFFAVHGRRPGRQAD